MSGVVALHHVQLACPVGSEDALRRFYAGLLGVPEVVKPPVLSARGGVWFRGPGVELHLGVEENFRPARKAHPGLVVADLAGLVARLAAAGVEARWDGDLPGYRRCYVDDPVGNRVELLEPRWSVPPRGRRGSGSRRAPEPRQLAGGRPVGVSAGRCRAAGAGPRGRTGRSRPG